MNDFFLSRSLLMLLLMTLLCNLGTAQLITYQNYSASTIPYAASVGAPTDLLCFTGWSLVQSADSLTIFCNDTITDLLWQMNAPIVPQVNAPAASFNWSVPYTPVGVWYVFGDCTFEIIQCNATHSHNYSEIHDDESQDNPCPSSSIVAIYHVCTNAAVVNVNLRPLEADSVRGFSVDSPDVWLYNAALPPASPCTPPTPLPIELFVRNNAFDIAASVLGMVGDVAILIIGALLLSFVTYLVWVFVLRKPKYGDSHGAIELGTV